MIWSLGAACLWLIAANVIAMLPSRDHHWRSAYLMIAAGLPLLVWVGLSAGWLAAAAFLGAGGSVLRWPVYFLWQWLRRPFGGRGG
ncbi:MAG: DUF2484 family protein [Paracoccaceae bacterium]